MAGLNGFSLALAILTLTAHTMSTLGAGFVCLCYWFLPQGTHFRHRLIQNLAVADLMNHGMGALVQLYTLATQHGISNGIWCKLDGLFVTIAVQAVDMAILSVAIVTVFSLTRPRAFCEWTNRKGLAVIAACWTPPIINGVTPLALGYMVPVSGGWCWIKEKPVYLRYVFTHGWRFAVILIVIGLYTYLHFYLRAHYKSLRSAAGSSHMSTMGCIVAQSSSSYPRHTRQQTSISGPLDGEQEKVEGPANPASRDIQVEIAVEVLEEDLVAEVEYPTMHRFSSQAALNTVRPHPESMSAGQASRRTRVSENTIQKCLLLRAYPTFYVLFWIPGIANRVVEATGHSSKVLTVLQTSTALVGLANACTYGWNEEIHKQLSRQLGRRRRELSLERP